MRKNIIALVCTFAMVGAGNVMAQSAPEWHGTVRGKYEYQPAMGASRFEVRNARISVQGKVMPIVEYKAEIDLSDEGSIKMLDAYTRIRPSKAFAFTIGQMRVPFTIDAHRSPHLQYFANRSFIAKQVGNVRDVGAMVSYRTSGATPIEISGGVFNGSGLTNQKNFWTNSINFSAKASAALPCGLTPQISVQKICPSDVRVVMYDAGVTYKTGNWTLEGEYLYKTYAKDAFDAVHAVDAFVCYDHWLPANERKIFKKISFLGRYDYMSDHSEGKTLDDNGALKVTDYERSRATAGCTFSFGYKGFVADIRLNYEKYFYEAGRSVAKVSEGDKLVVEFMTRF